MRLLAGGSLGNPVLCSRNCIEVGRPHQSDSRFYARRMLLYNSQVSGNCYKVRLLLAHLGAAYERREVDVVDRSNRAELLGGLNPALRVPALVLDDGRSLAESNAILWYLARGHAVRAPPTRSTARSCCSGCSSSSTATSRTSRWSGSGSPSPPRRRPRARSRPGARRVTRRSTRWSASSRRERFSWRHLHDRRHRAVRLHARRGRGRFELSGYPAIRAWIERVAAQPGHVSIGA